jgi:hypothetical protein
MSAKALVTAGLTDRPWPGPAAPDVELAVHPATRR